jgi:hypothetical protein
MITITNFAISNDLLEMNIGIEVDGGETVTSLVLWNQDTFKDDTQKIDLSSKIVGSGNTESIDIVPTDISESKFDGMYFIEIVSSDSADNAAVVAAISLRQYYHVVTALLYTVNTHCLNCNGNLQNALVLDMYLEGIKTALQVGRFRDAITFLSKINIITHTQDCDGCTQTTVNNTGDGWISVGVIDCVLESA